MEKIKSQEFIVSLKSGLDEINKSNLFDKIFLFFWLTGPFIYLIERSPADIWLSLIGLFFLIRSFKNKDWAWVKQPWFLFALLLWVVGLVSAIQGPMPNFSFGQGFVWIRFPLYAAAAQVWLGRSKEIRLLMLTVLTISLLLMSFILFSETLIEPKIRLMWPYGDVIPGSFIAKTCLPVFCILTSALFFRINKVFFLLIIIITIGITALKLTGERSNLILVTCAIITTIVFINFSIKRMILVGFLTLILGYITIYTFSSLTNRCTEIDCSSQVNIFDQIPIKNFQGSYWGAWRGGLQQGLERPLLGVGPSGTRHTCGYLQNHWLPGKNFCGNHPHNFYIQLFSETGLVGLLVGSLMVFFIIKICVQARKFDPSCKMASTAFIIPLGIFFPLQHFGSFYGQWGNLFLWFAIGFALSQTHNLRIKKQ